MNDTTPTTLITGGSGFIGVAVGRELAAAGHRVVLADQRPLSAQGAFILGTHADAVEVVGLEVDSWPSVMDLVRTSGARNIVHLAAVAAPTTLQSNPLLALRVNVEGTFNVLEAARQHQVERVIFFSSIGVLPGVRYEPIDADHPTVTATEGPGSGFYGASKLAGEAFSLSYVTSFGLDVRIIRPSAVYGFGMNWPIFMKPMVEGAVRGEAVHLESGASFPRDYTHVADIAGLTRALIDAADPADRIFYGATGEPLVTAGELARIVQEVVPGAQITVADRLTPADELELRYRGRISVHNAHSQLGWRPRYASLRDGVRQYAEQYRTYLERNSHPR